MFAFRGDRLQIEAHDEPDADELRAKIVAQENRRAKHVREDASYLGISTSLCVKHLLTQLDKQVDVAQIDQFFQEHDPSYGIDSLVVFLVKCGLQAQKRQVNFQVEPVSTDLPMIAFSRSGVPLVISVIEDDGKLEIGFFNPAGELSIRHVPAVRLATLVRPEVLVAQHGAMLAPKHSPISAPTRRFSELASRPVRIAALVSGHARELRGRAGNALRRLKSLSRLPRMVLAVLQGAPKPMAADADKGHRNPAQGLHGEDFTALDDGWQAAESDGFRFEDTLVWCVQHVLSLSGLAFSKGAVRDLPELTGRSFDPRSAVSALRHVGFESDYGEMDPAALRTGHCPAIGFLNDGQAVIVHGIDEHGEVQLRRAGLKEDFIEERLPQEALTERLLPFFVLARKVHAAAKVRGNNDWFWGSLLQGKWLYVQVLIAAALTNFLGLSTSLFIMVVYDRVVPNEAIESLIALTIGVLIALGFDFLIKTLRAQFVDKAGKRADARMSRLIFDKILNIKLDTRRQKSGAMASIVREFDTLREFFTSATLVAVVDLPFIFLFIWVISLIAGPLALVPLIAVPLVILAGLAIQPFLARITESSMKSNMSKQSVLVETLNGLETVQATGSGRLMRRRFEEASDAQSDLGLKSRMLSNFAINSAASVQQLAQIATIFYGVFLIQDGTITMGAMIAAVILGGRTLAPLSQLASAMSRANGAREAYRSLSSVMNPKDGEVDETRPRLSRPHLAGNIELKGLSYTFPGANSPILRDVSLKIPAGQKVAIVGRMGSGKSTLSRLIAGLIEPSEGAVLIDGVDLRQIDKSDVRRNLGVMLQETWLFSGTVKENLQMGFYEYDDAHLLNIAKISGVDDFVAGHPQGYDMELQERGEGLSGGQRQSINLARALLHNPNLLVLDEPTSSMDTATEKAVIDRLQAWAGNRTLVMVTHRNTLLQLAERVLVIDKGVIVADTTPEQLKAQAR